MCNFYDVTAKVEVYDKDYGVSFINVESCINVRMEDTDDLYSGVRDFLNDLFNHKISKIVYLDIQLDDTELPF